MECELGMVIIYSRDSISSSIQHWLGIWSADYLPASLPSLPRLNPSLSHCITPSHVFPQSPHLLHCLSLTTSPLTSISAPPPLKNSKPSHSEPGVPEPGALSAYLSIYLSIFQRQDCTWCECIILRMRRNITSEGKGLRGSDLNPVRKGWERAEGRRRRRRRRGLKWDGYRYTSPPTSIIPRLVCEAR